MEAAMPYAPGEGPFRCRGALYLEGFEYYDAKLPGGRQAVLDALAPPVRAFLSSRILPSAMYDLFPMIPLGDAVARVAGTTTRDVVRDTARWVGEKHLGTLFKLLLRVASPEMVAMRLPRASMRYFDFGDAQSRMIAPSVCESFQTGIPRPLVEWYAAGVEGFTPVALAAAGAHGIEVRRQPPITSGSRFGIDIVTLRFEFAWRRE